MPATTVRGVTRMSGHLHLVQARATGRKRGGEELQIGDEVGGRAEGGVAARRLDSPG
jgi:hypothetical protein